MNELPTEIQIHVLTIALDIHPVPSSILRVNRSWSDALTPLLHCNIRLQSLPQLYRFTKTARLSRVPKSFSLRLAGGFGLVHFTGSSQADGTLASGTEDTMQKHDYIKAIKIKVFDSGGVWGCLKAALQICSKVETVILQLHSFVSDPNLQRIASSLAVINPRSFKWTGPDPDHHLSTAVGSGTSPNSRIRHTDNGWHEQIVAQATEPLFRAIKSWSKLERLVLTNIKFPGPPLSSVLCSVFAFQSHSRLREICIGQSVALRPDDVAAMVMNIPSLRTLTLEDAYITSIWGPRTSEGDIVDVFSHLSDGDPRKQRLEEVIKCTARTERINK